MPALARRTTPAALEGELALLELEWKEAEEVAGIADRLGLPESVEQQFEELRRRDASDKRWLNACVG